MYLFPLGSPPATQPWTQYELETRVYRKPWVPTPIELETCWHIFVENVDPVVRILHKPTVRGLLDEAQQKGLEGLPRPSTALLLAICFSAMVTLDPWRSKALFNADGNEAIQRCKHAVEHAMADAQLIQTHDIQVLQAFTLFLVGNLQIYGAIDSFHIRLSGLTRPMVSTRRACNGGIRSPCGH